MTALPGWVRAGVVARLRAAAGRGPHIVVLTGAGTSTDSGIPDFRGPQGYWTVGSRNHAPEQLATAAMFRRSPEAVWSWYLYRLDACRRAEPNAAHTALARLCRELGERAVLVTQNVDGLHARAGTPPQRLIEIHGNIGWMRCARACTSARHRVPLDVPRPARHATLTADELAALRCGRCGGWCRPHVLWFDEFYDEVNYRAHTALATADRCSLLVTVGTTGATTLPARMAAVAARHGALLIDINLTDNVFAQLAARTGGGALRGRATHLVPALVDAVLAAARDAGGR